MSFDKRVLFVAPDTDLPYIAKEKEAVVNILGARLLNGKVEVDDLIREIRHFQPQLIIFSTHGTRDGIVLSDGVIGADLLKPILSTTPVECVYLNTCESHEVAASIYNELPTSFISSIQLVPDKLAYVAMTVFAQHLADGLSYAEAWWRSKPADNRNFVFWPAISRRSGRGTRMGNQTPSTNNSTRNSNGDLRELREKVNILGYLIHGNEKWGLPGILPTLSQLKQESTQIRVLLILLIVLGLLLAAMTMGQKFL